MDNFLIVTNDGKDVGHVITMKIKALLEEAGKTCVICQKNEDKKIIRESLPDEIDCALVVGGDGSLIEVARMLQHRDVPILGVNMGTLGYLTEVEVSNINEAIQQIADGDYVIEERMMLEGVFQDQSGDISLNDIVVCRKGELRVIHFQLYVNGSFLNSYEADGIIISTPTGSTAYNLSAGGPIVEPTASLIVISPICPHVLNTSSIVLSSEDEIIVEIGMGRNGTEEEVFVSFDGADTMTLKTGEWVKIHRAQASTKIMKLSKISFLETLRRKMKGN